MDLFLLYFPSTSSKVSLGYRNSFILFLTSSGEDRDYSRMTQFLRDQASDSEEVVTPLMSAVALLMVSPNL